MAPAPSGCNISLPLSCIKSSPVAFAVVLQKRHKWMDALTRGWKRSPKSAASATEPSNMPDLEDPEKRRQFMSEMMQSKIEDNIFQEELDASQSHTTSSPAEDVVTNARKQVVVDPDPRARVRWQRKRVIQMVRRNSQISREERIKMTERELTHKTEFMPTSVKKLVMLSRQIAGKTVDDAITQMSWSKKKMAREVRYYLEEARDLAIAQRGMGLGPANGEILAVPRKIQTNEGKWLEVTDPTRMYIAQSWVGRGPDRGKEIDYKGRGRRGIIRHPSTSKSENFK